MASRLNPYLNFGDNAREAMDFYRSVLGGELSLTTFGEAGMEGAPEGGVMHAMLETPAGFTLMASDAPPGTEVSSGSNFAISLSGDDEAELRGYWDGLAEGGSVTFPLEKAPWGDTFGMLTDQFGMTWMVNIAGTPS